MCKVATHKRAVAEALKIVLSGRPFLIMQVREISKGVHSTSSVFHKLYPGAIDALDYEFSRAVECHLRVRK